MKISTLLTLLTLLNANNIINAIYAVTQYAGKCNVNTNAFVGTEQVKISENVLRRVVWEKRFHKKTTKTN